MFYENMTFHKELDIRKVRFIELLESPKKPSAQERDGAFWELFYVRKGSVRITTASGSFTLSKANLFLRCPGETLSLHEDDTSFMELFCIGFDCGDDALNFLAAQLLAIGVSERRLLEHLICEASVVPYAGFAADQLILLYLQLLLISLIRSVLHDITAAPVSLSERRRSEDELFQTVVSYMKEHLKEHLTIEQICRDNLTSRSLLQRAFADNTDCGIIDYFSLMKINAAKQLIRENNMNFSQIAEYMGYNSIHYFSRHFKKLTGETPSAYASRVRGL